MALGIQPFYTFDVIKSSQHLITFLFSLPFVAESFGVKRTRKHGIFIDEFQGCDLPLFKGCWAKVTVVLLLFYFLPLIDQAKLSL